MRDVHDESVTIKQKSNSRHAQRPSPKMLSVSLISCFYEVISNPLYQLVFQNLFTSKAFDGSTFVHFASLWCDLQELNMTLYGSNAPKIWDLDPLISSYEVQVNVGNEMLNIVQQCRTMWNNIEQCPTIFFFNFKFLDMCFGPCKWVRSVFEF